MQSRDSNNLRGIDVSNWQGNINFAAVKNSGIQVVYMKASEGNYYRDTYLDQNYSNAKAQGLKVGFYHFFRSNVDSAAQAQYFVNCIQGKESDCRLAIDIETTEGYGRDAISSKCVTFLEEVKRLTGKDVVVYTYTNFINNYLNSSLSVYPLWVAHYGVDTPGDNCVWNSWVGFQYASDGQVPGVSGNCDMDEYTTGILLDPNNPVSPPDSQDQSSQRGPNPTIIWDYQYDGQIEDLQRVLNGKGYSLAVDGLSGDLTYGAVKNFTINLYDRGPLTKWVQDRINALGYNAGYADGYAEQPTMDGIARFQQAYSLGVGYLGSRIVAMSFCEPRSW